jgi:hypothetical protein
MRGGRSTAGVGFTAVALLAAAAALGGGACSSVDLGSPPADVNACRPDQTYFVKTIWPDVLAQDYNGKHCYDSGCHDQGSGRPLTLVVPADPMPPLGAGTTLPADWMADYLSASEQMQCSSPAGSELLTRPDGERTHGGGKLFEPTGTEAGLILMWVMQ